MNIFGFWLLCCINWCVVFFLFRQIQVLGVRIELRWEISFPKCWELCLRGELGPQVLGALFVNCQGKWASTEALVIFQLGRWQPTLKVIDEAENSALKCWEHCLPKHCPFFFTRKMAAYFEGNWQGRELGFQVSGVLFANYHGKWASAEALPIF